MKIALIAVTDSSLETARLLALSFPGAQVFRPEKGELKTLTAEIFHSYDGLVFIMAMGIVIRMIAPHLTDKYRDPAVVTVDDARRFAVSTLSGHEGGANDLTWKVAAALDALPVVTTASDTNRKVILGIGCRRGIRPEAVAEAVRRILDRNGLTAGDIRCAATVDIKRAETGLIRALEDLGIPLFFIPADRIRESGLKGLTPSRAAMKHLKLTGVSEPCAILAGKDARLIQKRTVYQGVTAALAEEHLTPEA